MAISVLALGMQRSVRPSIFRLVVLLAVCAGAGPRRIAAPVTAQSQYRILLPIGVRDLVWPGFAAPPTDLIFGRTGHTATRLADGSVLIVGGRTRDEWPTASVERWNPATGRSQLVARLATARSDQIADPLPDGRVLVAGGEGGRPDEDAANPLASAELFDPHSGKWLGLPAMHTARMGASAVVLADGRVLVVGGVGTIDVPATAEVFDPVRETWTRAGDLVMTDGWLRTTRLADGRVLAVAIRDSAAGSALEAELFDPAIGAWRITGDPHTSDPISAIARLLDGDVVMVNGATAERFDPVSETWRPAADPPFPVSGTSATLLQDGEVLLVGGRGGSTRFALYESQADRWETPGYTHFGRDGPTVTVLADGRVLATGGIYDDNYSAVTEVYEPATRSWMTSSPAPQGRFDHTATTLDTGEILLVGGQTDLGSSYYMPRPVLVTPWTNHWDVLGFMSTERYRHTATPLADGRVLVTGGVVAGGDPADTEIFDPHTREWTRADDLTVPRAGHRAIRLQDGTVLVVGGGNPDEPRTALAERYDPLTGVWRPAGRIQAHRGEHALTLLRDGRVLAVGGVSGAVYGPSAHRSDSDHRFDSVDLFDPATDSWQAAAPLLRGRLDHGATLLPDGRVLVAGGCCAGPSDGRHDELTSAELYDPRADAWQPTGSLNVGRWSHSAYLLPDGRVLVVGGCCSESVAASAELYDPASGTWQSTSSLNRARSATGSTQLPDGRVVVISGCCDVSYEPFDSLEWYDPAAGVWRLVERSTLATGNGG